MGPPEWVGSLLFSFLTDTETDLLTYGDRFMVSLYHKHVLYFIWRTYTGGAPAS